MSEQVLTRTEGPVATVTLNRPEKMNALDTPMWRALAEAFEHLAEAPDIRVIVLEGAGERAFAAGADISEFDENRNDPAQAEAYDALMRRALTAIRDNPKPVVARLHGNVIGGGLELAANCDIRIAAEGSRYGVPISRIGVVMGYPEIAAILELCSGPAMLSVLLEGRIFGAEEALRLGLVSRVVPADALDTEVAATVDRIAKGAPHCHAFHKRFVRRLMRPEPVTDAEQAEQYDFLSHADYREGIQAFRDKRKPVFRGK